jgi:hypothetical protein
VKNYFMNHKKEIESHYNHVKTSQPAAAIDGPAFLFGNHVKVTDVELRSEMPPKSAVEKLVSRFFNSNDPAVHILHAPTFHKQLHDHWQDQSKTSVVWLGLLYAIMSLAMQSYHKIGDEPLEWKGRTLELSGEYRLRTVQCLITSDYTKSSDHTLETLILYVHGEYNSRFDAEVGIYVIVGMIVRLAQRMGYHRDASRFPGVSPFQGEMRRRIWGFIRQSDSIFSFQLALPSMIRPRDCDAELPRNLFEDELSVDMKELPPARPITEPTPVSYMITKIRLSTEFGIIVEEINAVSGRVFGYDEVMAHDNRLRELKASMPPHLKLKPLEECKHDPATLLMQRFSLDIHFQKSICVLHRKYIARARQNSRYSYSRRACVDAATQILRHQRQLYLESQPGGRLHTMKWFISSLTTHDFLLGAVIVCLDLHYDSVSERSNSRTMSDPYFWTAAERAEMFSAVEMSWHIWKQSCQKSLEAFKAEKILSIMLEKLRNPVPTAGPQSGPDSSVSTPPFTNFDQEKPEHSAAMTLGMLSGGLTPGSAALFNSASPNSPGGQRFAGFDMPMTGDSSSNGLTPGFGMDGSYVPAQSPFGMGFGGSMMDTSNLDWVRLTFLLFPFLPPLCTIAICLLLAINCRPMACGTRTAY